MDVKDLRQKTDKELRDLLLEQRESLRKLRFKASERQLKNVREIRQVRRNLAQIMTVIQER